MSETLAAVIRAEPDFDSLPSDTPGPVLRILQLCLTKDPKERARDIGDVRLAMRGAFESASEAATAPSGWRRSIATAVAAALVFSVVMSVTAWQTFRPAPSPGVVARFSVPLLGVVRGVSSNSGRRLLDISKDGARVIYGSNDQLYVRAMDEIVATPIRGTEGARSPSFSPNGEWVVTRDKERLDRFEREARLLAQLNHANIATLHGLEEHDGQKFLVMELVEGETLAERIAQGRLPVDEAIPLFIQIAEGLEAAHETGIIHRDLKPANIKIGPDGKPKILDFGLAKAFVGDTEVAPDSSQSPTLTRGTALGAIMGTASYMSPEQARGKLVDRRTDVWAFGCCLYEALTGRRAFEGEKVPDTLSAVLSKETDWTRVPAGSPSGLLERMLRRDATRRLQHVGDARVELLDSSSTESVVSSSARLIVDDLVCGYRARCGRAWFLDAW